MERYIKWILRLCLIFAILIEKKRLSAADFEAKGTYRTCSSIIDQFTVVTNYESTKTGFHRDIEIYLKVTTTILDQNTHEFAMQLNLPSSVFVDPFQFPRENSENILLPKNIDIEASAVTSPTLPILFYWSILKESEVNLTIPIHIRYHRPQQRGEAVAFRLTPPTILVKLNEKFDDVTGTVVAAPCNARNQSECKWCPFPAQELSDIELSVPVGQTKHTEIVVIVTTTVTLLSCVYLARVICRSVARRKCKNS